MATRANQPQGTQAKTANPIAHVEYQSRDLSAVVSAGGGAKELVPVTPDLRNALTKSMVEAGKSITAEATHNPDVPGVMVIRLRDIAVAKSHRPLDLIYEASMPQAGHGEINEMLVAVNPVSLKQLEGVIADRNTKKIRANISTVEGFEAWNTQRRLPRNLRQLSLSNVLQSLQALNRRLMIRTFSHRSETTSRLVIERLTQLLQTNNVTFTVLPQRIGPPLFLAQINDAMTLQVFTDIVQFQGVRQIRPEPQVLPTSTGIQATVVPQFTTATPPSGLPTVAVFDSGVDPKSAPMAPWIVSRDPYVLPPDTDYVHGTAVGSLIVDSYSLNGNHHYFPMTSCLIHDVCALETGGAPETDLIIRLREAIAKHPAIKVWNLSLGGMEIADDEFSDFGRKLDALSDTYGVLFVVAAGNYGQLPRRGWPVNGAVLNDRISSPSDSVRALTVGAVAHRASATSLVQVDEPAPYSRRGPGPVFTPKPDIVHVGGNADANMNPAGVGIHVLAPGDQFPCGCGTSYASPIVAAIAARTWQSLALPSRPYSVAVSPTMVKALMIHSAQLNSPERQPAERRYYGAGFPGDPISILYDTDSSFTMLFELDIVDTMKWRKSPYPIPPSLLHEGKLRAEVIITAVYAPPLDPAAGAEYVRFNVDIGFGKLAPNAKGELGFHGCVPAVGEIGTTGFEEAQVEHGGKWAPVKIYRRRFPHGVAGQLWALQATMLRRAFEPALAQPLRVVVAVTLRSLDGNPNVYEEGRRLLAQSNWISQDLSQRVAVQVRGS